MSVRPVAILAYSKDTNQELSKLDEERMSVANLFEDTDLTVKVDSKITPEKLEGLWLKYRDEVMVFHFGGHAGPSVLQLNQDEFTAKVVFAKGISDFIEKFCRNIKLVFLNGCSTEDQASYFLDRGVSAVIATEMPVKDEVASCFAERFYTFFLKNNLSLRDAFDAAQMSLTGRFGSSRATDENGDLNAALLVANLRDLAGFDVADPHRGPLHIGRQLPADTALYQLKIHPEKPQTENETFQDWGAGFARQTGIKKTDDPLQAKSAGVDAKSYLLCNRSKQYPEFEKVLQQKRAGQAPDPFFFFVHAEEEHCPDDLSERFTHYGLPALCRQNGFAEEIDLAEPDVFSGGNPNDPANPTRDLFKTRLSELYKTSFDGEDAHDNLLCKLIRRPGNEEVLVVLHRLSPEEWSDYSDPALRAELNGKIETLLRYYIGDFSRYLRDGFSERLIVVFSIQYYEPDPFFPALFQRLETEFTINRVRVLGNLPRVRKTDLNRWQDEVLQQQFFLVNDVFLDRKGAPAMDLPFFDAKKILIPQIELFNRSKARDVHT